MNRLLIILGCCFIIGQLFNSILSAAQQSDTSFKKSSIKIITSSDQSPDEGPWVGSFFFKKTFGLEDATIEGKATFLDVDAHTLTITGSVPKAHKLWDAYC